MLLKQDSTGQTGLYNRKRYSKTLRSATAARISTGATPSAVVRDGTFRTDRNTIGPVQRPVRFGSED